VTAIDLALALLLMALVATVPRAWLRRRAFERRTRGLAGRVVDEETARGTVDGVAVLATRREVELELACKKPAILGRADLLEIAAGPDHSPALAAFAGKPDARAASERLLAAGTKRLELGEERAVATGLSTSCDLAEVARAAIALAHAPLVSAARGRGVCPFCKDDVKRLESQGTVRCPECESVHHTPCWNENGGCATFQCQRAPRGRDAERRVAVLRARELAEHGDLGAARAELDRARRLDGPSARDGSR
jgi:hypothetical protein